MKLIHENMRQYKVELHSHTACSDGDYTPAELKKQYQQRGYDAVAFTDHDIFLRHNELTDEAFVALNGYELNVPTEAHRALRSFHINFIAGDPNTEEMPGYAPIYVFQKNAKTYIDQVKGAEPSGFRDFSTEGLNHLIKAGNDRGFLVTLNHPGWSMATEGDVLPLEGLFALEVHNSGTEKYRNMDEALYQNMLLMGKELNCLATNDFHSFRKEDMTAAVYVQAECLTYAALIEALRQGHFYSSTGPRIQRLEIVEDVLYLACSAVSSVVIETATEHPTHITAQDDSITGGSFPLKMAEKEWFRVTLTDKEGKKAWTNGIFRYPQMALQQAHPQGCESLILCGREEALGAEEGKTCFLKERISDQIRELIFLARRMKSRKVTAAFSVTESLRFDLYYYGGRALQEQKQQESLAQMEIALVELAAWLKETGVRLKLISMRPLPHNPAIFDYRNSHIRAINERLKAFSEENGLEFVDVYGEMAQENGILKPEMEKDENRRACYLSALRQ